MSISLNLSTSDGSMFSFPISRADWELIDSIRLQIPDEIAIVFGDGGVESERTISTEHALTATIRISSFIDNSTDLLPITYQFKYERSSDARSKPGGYESGGISGIRFVDDVQHRYSLWAGVNKCKLRKMRLNADGTGTLVEEIDVRDRREIATESLGKICIRGTRKKTELRACLTLLEKFFKTVGTGDIAWNLS